MTKDKYMGMLDLLRDKTPVGSENEMVSPGDTEEFKGVIVEATQLENAGLIKLNVVSENLIQFCRLR